MNTTSKGRVHPYRRYRTYMISSCSSSRLGSTLLFSWVFSWVTRHCQSFGDVWYWAGCLSGYYTHHLSEFPVIDLFATRP